jgi:hypothetical protein
VALEERMFLIGIPLLVIPFAIYNIVEFLLPGASPGELWAKTLFELPMMSGATWSLTVGDLLLALSMLVLFVELVKATRLTGHTLLDHLLATLLFIGMLVEFLLVKQAATGTFFLLLVISFVDVVGGFTISIRAAQRDVTVEGVEKVIH